MAILSNIMYRLDEVRIGNVIVTIQASETGMAHDSYQLRAQRMLGGEAHRILGKAHTYSITGLCPYTIARELAASIEKYGIDIRGKLNHPVSDIRLVY